MAGLAKSILAEHAVSLGVGVAVDAIFQAVLRRSDAPAQGVITLMPK